MKQTLWKEYFNFSRQERRGIIALLILTSVFIAAPATWEYSYAPATVTDPVLTAEISLLRSFPSKTRYDKPRYAKHAPYVRIARERDSTQRHEWHEYRKAAIVVNINTADSTAWEALPGIGPVLAARIIRFRNKLGGFYSIQQIAETFGLADSTFRKIQPALRLDAVALNNLDINQMDEKTLAQHPYIRYKLARLIVLYRSNNGPFRQPEDLLGIPLVDDSIYRKLKPYIKTI